MAGGRSPKRKGEGYEREVRDVLREFGLAAERSYGAGALAAKPTYDLTCPVLGRDRKLECKRRGSSGLQSLYAWKADNYALVCRSDNRHSLVVIDLEDFARLVQAAELRKLEAA
jgi:hypothetical protein